MGMLLPVARRLLSEGSVDITFLGLTTAKAQVREAGYPVIGFADFLLPSDASAVERGRSLAANQGVHSSVGELESAAYLGLSYGDLEQSVGAEEAAALYAAQGRQAFLPVQTMRRVLEKLKPDLLVTTNSPRAERAAVMAARQSGVRCLCVNALLAIDEVAWLGTPGFADRVCVLNEAVRQRLLQAGRQADEVVVTGNPSFDALFDANAISEGNRWRRQLLERTGTSADAQVVMFAAQPEPLFHPTAPGKRGQVALPGMVAQALRTWAEAVPGQRIAVLRPHPSEPASTWSDWAEERLAGQSYPLAQVLHGVDVVVTLTSTVGLEAQVIGKPVVQVLGSIFDHALPLADLGLATRCRHPTELATILNAVMFPRIKRRIEARDAPAIANATERVCQQIHSLMP
jgi:hypothetical protein